MRFPVRCTLCIVAALLPCAPAGDRAGAAVQTGPNGEIRVDGRPFLPIMAHNQPVDLWPTLIELGVNTFAANARPRPDSTVAAYLAAAEKHHVYVMLSPHWIEAEGREAIDAVKRSSRVLTLRYPDEPDLTHKESDIRIDAPEAREDPARPLCMLFDGAPATRGALSPVKGFAMTVGVPERYMSVVGDERRPPVVARLAVMQHNADGWLTLPKRVQFLADGKELLTAELSDRHAVMQTFRLPKPVAVSALTVKVLDVHQRREAWGAWSELQALTADGTNVLQAEVRDVPRYAAATVAADCARWRKAYGLPILVGTTSRFAAIPTLETQRRPLPLTDYQTYHSAGDMAITNLFPLNWNGRPVTLDCHVLNQLSAIVGPRKPVAVWMAPGLPNPERAPSGARAPSPAELRANVVLNLIHGARMVPWFTQSWPKGTFKFVDVPAENAAEMKRIAAAAGRLAAALSCPEVEGPLWTLENVETDVAQPPRCQMVRKAADGSKYLFLVNATDRPVQATLELANGESLVPLLPQDFLLGRKGGTVRATFPPWYAQVYRIGR